MPYLYSKILDGQVFCVSNSVIITFHIKGFTCSGLCRTALYALVTLITILTRKIANIVCLRTLIYIRPVHTTACRQQQYVRRKPRL